MWRRRDGDREEQEEAHRFRSELHSGSAGVPCSVLEPATSHAHVPSLDSQATVASFPTRPLASGCILFLSP